MLISPGKARFGATSAAMIVEAPATRADRHKLFDLGYVTVTPDLRLEVSPKLKTEWQNGREYYAHHGQPLRMHPADQASRPSKEFLMWHNENRFRA